MKRRTFARIIPALTAMAVLIVIAFRAVLPPAHVTLRVFDIGQGDSILIEDGYGQALIDGGPDDAVLAKLGDAMPFFDRTIETVVLTHPHADHYAGLIGVLKRYKVKTVITDGRERDDDAEYRRFEETVEASGAVIVEAKAGDRLALGDRATIAVLWPPRDPARLTGVDRRDENAWSLVLRLEAEGASAYLMGDATDDVERRLVEVGRLAPADLLKVGHHGSRYSSASKFLDAVRPKDAVISVGKNNYGHPAWSTVRRLESHGARVWRTDEVGGVVAAFKEGTIILRAQK